MTTPLARLYQEISRPSPLKPAVKITQTGPVEPSAADVDAIVKRRRSGSIAELEYIIASAKKLGLKPAQRNDLCVQLTILQSNQGRRPVSPNAKLFAQLDVAETPVGLLHHRSWFETELRVASQAIASCKLHRPPRCQCWQTVRERLWQVQDRYGANSPEGWVATRMWELLEEYEQTRTRAGIATDTGD